MTVADVEDEGEGVNELDCDAAALRVIVALPLTEEVDETEGARVALLVVLVLCEEEEVLEPLGVAVEDAVGNADADGFGEGEDSDHEITTFFRFTFDRAAEVIT